MKLCLSLCLAFLLALLASPAKSQLVWQKHPSNPVVPHWTGDVDDPSGYKYTMGPSVIHSDEKVFHMWFSSLAYGYGTSFCISEAVSFDGLRWYANMWNPVIRPTPNSFDARSIYSPVVIRDPAGYKLYYAGYSGARFAVGLATSPDAIHWTKHPANPVLTGGPPGSWNYDVRQMAVHFDGTTYHALFDGRSSSGVWSIGYATSPDGIAWTQSSENPVLAAGPTGSFDEAGVGEPTIVYSGAKYHMLYTGYAPPGLIGRIGYASSTDGTTWTKYVGNPVLNLGGSGSWDAGHLAAGSLLLKDSTFHLWYVGADDPVTAYEIGFASAPLVTGVEERSGLPSRPLEFSLMNNYPNPFNPTTTVTYSLPEQCVITLRICSVLGQEVRVLRTGSDGPGISSAVWDGRTGTGVEAGSGLYVAYLEAAGLSGARYKASSKMMLTK